jgi:hypothetical protein
MAGAGPKRVKPQRGGKPKVGVEGEDVAYSESGDIYLRMPARFGVGTMKAAAWLVSADLRHIGTVDATGYLVSAACLVLIYFAAAISRPC